MAMRFMRIVKFHCTRCFDYFPARLKALPLDPAKIFESDGDVKGYYHGRHRGARGKARTSPKLFGTLPIPPADYNSRHAQKMIPERRSPGGVMQMLRTTVLIAGLLLGQTALAEGVWQSLGDYVSKEESGNQVELTAT